MVARGGDHFAAPTLEAAEQGKPPVTLGQRLKAVGRAVVTRGASSLTRRIVLLNLLGLVALLLGFLYLNQFREGLIDARVQSLSTQGEIIAGAVAASATADTDTVTIDPDKLLQMQAGESYGLNDDTQSPLEFSINPEKVGPLVRRLVTPTRTRARVYDREGLLLIDSRFLYVRGDITRLDLPPLAAEEPTVIERTWNAIRGRFGRSSLPLVEDFGAADGKSLPEVTRALSGIPGSVVRVIASGETIVSVAVPIQRSKSVRGALLLSTQGGDIDQMIAKERFGILQVFLIAALVMVVLSVLLAGTIAEPIRRLAEAAERVRRGRRSP
jgi:two-component system, OmpR family, sensor histidine kinase ChvG